MYNLLQSHYLVVLGFIKDYKALCIVCLQKDFDFEELNSFVPVTEKLCAIKEVMHSYTKIHAVIKPIGFTRRLDLCNRGFNGFAFCFHHCQVVEKQSSSECIYFPSMDIQFLS